VVNIVEACLGLDLRGRALVLVLAVLVLARSNGWIRREEPNVRVAVVIKGSDCALGKSNGYISSVCKSNEYAYQYTSPTNTQSLVCTTAVCSLSISMYHCYMLVQYVPSLHAR
jgi:hypothetical protein